MAESPLRALMVEHRLTVDEVARGAGLGRSTIVRLRASPSQDVRPRPTTIRRVAEAMADLAHLDSDELYRDMMVAYGHDSRVRQTELEVRGVAQLTGFYRRMNPLARHILLEHARLLARELPASEE